MKPKFGLVGCGNIAQFHIKGLRKVGANIVHIADWNEQAARPYAEQFGARLSADYRAVVADPEVTVVSVLTGAKSHRDVCLAALEAGKDVICEKTMANDRRESIEIARAAKASGRLFFASYMKRFFPAVRKAKELLPGLGRLISVQVRAYQQWSGMELEHPDVQQRLLDNYGGAVVKCAGSHMLDMTMHLLGRPAGVYAQVDYVPHSRIDRRATALFEYEDGLAVSYETAVHPLKRIGYERNSWDERIEINGENGRIEICTVQWDASEHRAALLVHYDNERETSSEYRFAAVDPFDVEMAYFHECLTKREAGTPDVVDGMNVDILIDAIMTSADRKARVAIDWPAL